MSRSRFGLLAVPLLLIGLSAPIPAQDQGKATETVPAGKIELQWKFEKDKPIYAAMNTKTQQDMRVMGMEVKQTHDQTFYFSWTMKDEDKENHTILTQKIEGVRLDIDVAGNRITFDSAAPTSGSSTLNDFFRALVNSEFKLTLDKDMKVTKVDGREAFVQKLTQQNQPMDTLLKRILSEEALMQMADPTFGILPPHEVAPGDTWERTSTLNLGPIGSYRSLHKYTYKGQDEKNKDLAQIDVETTLTYEAPTDPGEGLPFKIKTADLKSKSAKGTILFNTAKGRLEESVQSLELEGTLDIEISTMSTKVELKQRQDTTVKVSDEPQQGK